MTPSFHEVVHTLRAVRRLKPDPVSREDLEYVLEAAVQACSSANTQTWRFVVVTDPVLRARLGELYEEIASRSVRRVAEGERPARDEDERRVYRNTWRFAQRFGQAPAIVVCCLQEARPGNMEWNPPYYGSIFPAVQNLMLAARARGLGTVLTTLHLLEESRLKELLGLPEDVNPEAVIPLGHPESGFKPPKRRSAREVTHWEHWSA